MSSASTGVSSRDEVRGLRANYVDVDGIRTRYYDVGAGQPLVLVAGHGWSGYFNANLWDTNIEGLSQHFRVIVPDKLGTGMTDNPPPSNYTIQAQVKHMTRFMETLGLQDIHLAGQSRGGYLVARIALENPSLLRRLIIVGTGTLAPEIGSSTERRAALFAGLPKDLKELLRVRLGRLSYSPAHISDEMLDADVYIENLPKAQQGKQIWEGGGEALFGETLAAQKTETLNWIEERGFAMPTLLYWGVNDTNALFAQG
ncbi:MAG: alpha/beta hydrolase, partial [Chloroflexi bacterium]|nr:alpha/beta hydrolase [Chloroflexota bacterium]